MSRIPAPRYDDGEPFTKDELREWAFDYLPLYLAGQLDKAGVDAATVNELVKFGVFVAGEVSDTWDALDAEEKREIADGALSILRGMRGMTR